MTYEISDELDWKKVTEINFGAYPLPEGETLNFYFANFKDETTVYHHYGEDKAFRIQWNPKTAKIVKAHTDTHLPAPTETTAISGSGNRTDVRWFKGPVMQPFQQTLLETDEYGPQSFIAVYDETTHAEKSLITVDDCPGLEQTTMDENGDLYFSTTYHFSVPALYGKGLPSCVVKVSADGTRDESFDTDLTKLTGGHQFINFRYLADGKATAHVLHEERMGLEWEGEPDLTRWDTIWEDASLWDFVLIDLKTGAVKEVTGFDTEHDLGAYGRILELEGHHFLIYPSGDGNSVMYELRTDGTVTRGSDVTGEIWSVYRLR
jgi:hypothetical protein